MISDIRIYDTANTNYITDSMTYSSTYQSNLIRWLKLNGNTLDSSNNLQHATGTITYYVICSSGTWTVDPYVTCMDSDCSGKYVSIYI